MFRKTPRSIITLSTVILVAFSTSSAKLISSSLEAEKAKTIITEVFRQTRLNEGVSGWGDRYREDIDRFSKMFGMNYYTIFQDLGINNAFARAAAFAKYESDAQRWFDQMNLFDRAAEELTQKDKAKYYFAKGLLQVQLFPDKLRDLPEDFYKAAQNGYSSTFLSAYLTSNRTAQLPTADSSLVSTTLSRLAQSYQTGGFYEEAYKFYLLALKSGDLNPEYLHSMIDCAYSNGSEPLAYSTALLFVEIFSPYGGIRSERTGIIRSIQIDPGMSAEDIWQLCEKQGAISDLITNTSVAPPADAASRSYQSELDDFESRYISPIANSLGSYSDLFLIALCERYWEDASVAKRYVLRIKGAIDAGNGAIITMAAKVREDTRFSSDAELAQWEARRWKAGKQLKEFAAKYPDRFKLAGSPR